jgi:hypothetical protein
VDALVQSAQSGGIMLQGYQSAVLHGRPLERATFESLLPAAAFIVTLVRRPDEDGIQANDPCDEMTVPCVLVLATGEAMQ